MLYNQTVGGVHALLRDSDKKSITDTIRFLKISEVDELEFPIPDFQVPFVALFVRDGELILVCRGERDSHPFINCKRRTINLLMGGEANLYYTKNALGRFRHIPKMLSLLLRTGILSS